MVPRKIGVAPVQREGMEYEFDLYASMDWSHQIRVTKSRCSPMQDATTMNPGPRFWTPMFEWLGVGRYGRAPRTDRRAAAACDRDSGRRSRRGASTGPPTPTPSASYRRAGGRLYKRIADFGRKLEAANRCSKSAAMNFVAEQGQGGRVPRPDREVERRADRVRRRLRPRVREDARGRVSRRHLTTTLTPPRGGVFSFTTRLETPMSAWIVSKSHIDLMVTGLVFGTRDGVIRPKRPQPASTRPDAGQRMREVGQPPLPRLRRRGRGAGAARAERPVLPQAVPLRGPEVSPDGRRGSTRPRRATPTSPTSTTSGRTPTPSRSASTSTA